MLYEVKDGGERTGTFELLDLRSRTTLSDVLPRVICAASQSPLIAKASITYMK